MAEAPLYFSTADRERLEPHLPPPPESSSSPPPGSTGPSCPAPSPSPSPSPLSSALLPFVTLTFATSLDSALALGPGVRTALSGPESKAMTHYLRSRHDAICVGVGTAVADDPGLNSRLAADVAPVSDAVGGEEHEGSNSSGGGDRVEKKARQPRPIVIDPRLRWDFTAQSRVIQLARQGRGLAPYILTLEREPPTHKRVILEGVGGKFIILDADRAPPDGSRGAHRLGWRDMLSAVRREGLRSIMVEGGAEVINSLLGESIHLVDSIIVTIAPTWLGKGSVTVNPPRTLGAGKPVARLSNPMWLPLGDDVVLCGKPAR